MLLVLDTSVVLKWFAEEEGSEVAVGIKQGLVEGRYEVVVPELLRYELGNAMRYSEGFDEKTISESLKALRDIGVRVVIPTDQVMEDAASIAVEDDLTFYDSVFAALGLYLDATVVSSDEELVENIPEEIESVVLEDFERLA